MTEREVYNISFYVSNFSWILKLDFVSMQITSKQKYKLKIIIIWSL